jgi:DNA topoisomerase VI subunit B
MTEREIFTTSRLSEFTSVKELTTATGHGRDEWPLVVLKELVDNGIDAAEKAGVPAVIAITVAGNAITVTDNAAGIDADTVGKIVDFSTRTSGNEAYVSPTRGQQGNALQTILAMPFALDGGRGESVIESRGVKHSVIFEVDAIRRTPKVSLETARSAVKTGTKITIQWPVCASIQLQETKPRFVQIVEDYATFNPHMSITLKWDGRTEVDITAADPPWPKWLPDRLTSAHWYSLERFNTLIAATIAKDQDKGRDTLVREFIANTFPGMARSASQKNVLDRIEAARMPLATLFNEGKNQDSVVSLLAALKAETKPTKPVDLGIIGRDHMESRCIDAGADTEHFDFAYHKALGVTYDGLPWVVEAAFAYCPKAKSTDDTGDDDLGDADDNDDVETDDSKYRRLIAGCNWSPGIGDPFRIDTVLAEQRVDADAGNAKNGCENRAR